MTLDIDIVQPMLSLSEHGELVCGCTRSSSEFHYIQQPDVTGGMRLIAERVDHLVGLEAQNLYARQCTAPCANNTTVAFKQDRQ